MNAPVLRPDPPGLKPATGFFARYIALARVRGAWLMLILALVGLGAFALATRLELHTDMAELLPSDHPAVVALKNIQGKQKSSTNLVMLLGSDSDEVNLRFAEALKPRLESMVGSVFTEVQWHKDAEVPAFLQKNQWLYASLPELLDAERLLDRVRAQRTSPLAVDLEDGDPEAELRQLQDRLQKRVPAVPAGDYFFGKDGDKRYLGIMLWRRGDGLASVGDFETLDAVKKVVEQVDPRKFS
ncbi:MAG TPA: hypothetical protein VII08_19570, partial [Myxococcales bacterium]